LISGKLYTILALMTIITTLVATPLQRMFERRLNKSGSKFGPAGEEPYVDVHEASSASGSYTRSHTPQGRWRENERGNSLTDQTMIISG
ncbi:MAG TPA: hypothetical protein VFQ37_01945, partial [Mycobacterium sp.]|nr:hypothetical protein [Mycobacterium sp.]